MFRGFQATPAPRGVVDYAFVWLGPQLMQARCTMGGRRLTFPSLFPDVPAGSPLAADLSAIVAARAGRAVPPHKRLDARRVAATTTTRGGAWSLAIAIRGRQQAYAVRAGLGLVNDLWLLLGERYPDYLTEHFGMPAE